MKQRIILTALIAFLFIFVCRARREQVVSSFDDDITLTKMKWDDLHYGEKYALTMDRKGNDVTSLSWKANQGQYDPTIQCCRCWWAGKWYCDFRWVELNKNEDMVKIWWIWDLPYKKRNAYVDHAFVKRIWKNLRDGEIYRNEPDFNDQRWQKGSISELHNKKLNFQLGENTVVYQPHNIWEE